MVKRIIAIGVIFFCIAVGWIILSATTYIRTEEQDDKLKSAVGQLWGTAQTQRAPQIYWLERVTHIETIDGESVSRTVDEKHFLNLKASRIKLTCLWTTGAKACCGIPPIRCNSQPRTP